MAQDSSSEYERCAAFGIFRKMLSSYTKAFLMARNGNAKVKVLHFNPSKLNFNPFESKFNPFESDFERIEFDFNPFEFHFDPSKFHAPGSGSDHQKTGGGSASAG